VDRKLLIACLGLIAFTCFACAPPQQGVQANTAACDLASKVHVLYPGYSPLNRPYSSPNKSENWLNYPLRDEIKDDINTALANAPANVQTRLCKLTGVFITSTGCPNGNVNNCAPYSGGLFSDAYSWGYRSYDNSDNDKGSTYVAIPGILWYLGLNTHAEAFSDYENAILQRFAGWNNGPSITTPNDSWMTVLAALTHELGHVRFVEAVVPSGAGKNYDFSRLKSCTTRNGNINFFSGWAYGNKDQRLRPPNRWRNFADRTNDDGENYTEHSADPTIKYIYYSGKSPSVLSQAVYDLYQYGQPWSSLFGAQTPDEDFVETYVMYALAGRKLLDSTYNGPYLASLPLTISGITIPGHAGNYADVPYDLLANKKGTLADKIRCLDGLPLPP
jgi:hypothetical protein